MAVFMNGDTVIVVSEPRRTGGGIVLPGAIGRIVEVDPDGTVAAFWSLLQDSRNRDIDWWVGVEVLAHFDIGNPEHLEHWINDDLEFFEASL